MIINSVNNGLIIMCSDKTVRDFGEQWMIYQDNSGYYTSLDHLEDIINPLINISELKDAIVAEIGSGTGRIVKMLLEAQAKHVIALEPSDGFEILVKNLKEHNNVTLLNLTGEKLPPLGNCDFVFSIGVIHHIPNPEPVIQAAYDVLKRGGKIVLWLYGKEGNEIYLAYCKPIRLITSRLPDSLLRKLVMIMDFPLRLYMFLASRFHSLPLANYLDMLNKLSPEHRRLVMFDQLNPTYVKYYTMDEAINLVKDKFENIRIHHRRSYSWTVIATKTN